MKRFSASFEPFLLKFIKPAGTSRGFLLEKPSWLLKIRDNESGAEGIGECSIIPGLSIDDEKHVEDKLSELCKSIHENQDIEAHDVDLHKYPAIQFAKETAILDLAGGGKKILFNNPFSRGEQGILINGLVWMAHPDDMLKQAEEKFKNGYRTLKFKIGAIDFQSELNLIKTVRDHFGSEIEIRLDANGAFSDREVMSNLDRLSKFQIHSIEQPISAGNWKLMALICKESPIPVALDEELIGIYGLTHKSELLEAIQPQYIILKPSLLGGFKETDAWIFIAEKYGTGWWATSALESNVGLNAIAQWVAQKSPALAQGLGTGSLFSNNYRIPLKTLNGKLWFVW